jgi:iron complex transport system substrate-binding protein
MRAEQSLPAPATADLAGIDARRELILRSANVHTRSGRPAWARLGFLLPAYGGAAKEIECQPEYRPDPPVSNRHEKGNTMPAPYTISRRTALAGALGVGFSAVTGRSVFAKQEATPGPEQAVTYPVTVTHDAGETTLAAKPARIAALEWHLVEDLLVLGIQPAAIADVDGFKTWVTIEETLSEDVIDVGVRWEPSLEALAAAELDLILALDYRDAEIYDQLNAIAPTIMLNAFPETDGVTPLEDLRTRLRFEGSFLDRAAEAEAAIASMDGVIAEQASLIEQAGLTGAPYVAFQGFTGENAPVMRLFTDGSLMGDAITATGLVNAWTADGGDWGFTTNDVEAFIDLPEDVNVFFIINASDDILDTFLNDDPIWQSLPFVQAGRFFPLGGDTWTFGGSQSVERIVTRSTAQITGMAE